jgi:VIT1/CCC1 family predicted Fe2+/Mn2+ transporter
MAAGEYVSVHSQADTEQADIELERKELKADDKGEQHELMAIYVGRGLDPSLAKQVARQLMVHDAIGAHARDEFGISEILRAPSDSGYAGIGWVLRCWSGPPSLGHCDGTGEGPDSSCLRNFTALSRSSGRAS